MTLFGFKILDDIELPEFPFPELGALQEDNDPALSAAPGPTRRATPNDGAGGHGARPEPRYYH